MKVVEFAVPSPSDDATSSYHLGIEIDATANGSGQPPQSQHSNAPPNSQKGIRRLNTFTGAVPEEEQRNIISLRYRADSMADSIASENQESAEAKVFNVFERVFCFLKGMTIYQARRRLKFTIVTQSVVNTFRIFPIILGLSYQATLPVLILYITLILGWHGTKFLVPKFLLLYKIGMQMSLLVDVIWYFKGYNGKLNSVSSGTAVLMQGFFSIILTLLNLAGLLYGWKLRRIVKAVQNQRECDRAALATMVPPSPAARNGSMHHLRQTMSVNPVADLPEDERPAARRTIVIGPDVPPVGSRRKSLASGANGKATDAPAPFCGNLIRTSKYTFYNFPFVFLKMQFSRLANIYTTIVVGLCFFSFSPVSPVASLTPLLIVFATSALKDVSEDLRRQKADTQVNTKSAHIVRRDLTGTIKHMDAMWQDIEVGDMLILKDGDEVPADCILLATNRPDGRCYIETANLDGETNLKIRSVAKPTKHFLTADDILEKYKLHVECDAPNKDLFYFDGVLKVTNIHAQTEEGSTEESNLVDDTSLSMDNLILRGSESRNSEWTIAFVIYTGRDTKIAMNSSEVPLKRSFVEKTLDTMFVLVLVMLFGISVACTLGNNNWGWELDDANAPWYIGQATENGYIFLSYVILFNNLIPLSMYVTMEGVRFVHARYIESDIEMYDPKTDTPAQVRNSNINEDLGQIQYIFSDKTGTLTRNEMVFAKCTIAGLRYNDVEMDSEKPARPGTRFNDSRLVGRLNANHSTKKEITDFLLLLTICNTVIPEYDSPPASDNSGLSRPLGKVKYNAASPDEQALVLAANDLGFVLTGRDGPTCETMIQGVPMSFEILNVLEFNSDRKRMSIIFRHPDGSIILYCKGADDVLFDLLSKSQPQGVAHVTRGHLQEYASEGLRTLTTAMRRLTHEQYDEWNKLYRQAELSLDNRAAKIAKIAAVIEVELTLLGATAIEDRLQEGVEECITSLRKAGINFWVLTGDKKETALSIGMSSHVIDDNMDVIVLGQRDKASLRAKLEELYVDLVDDKWGSDEHSSAVSVLYEAFKRVFMIGWDLAKTMIYGRDEQAEARKKRRRMPRRGEHDEVEHTPTDSNTQFDEVYPALNPDNPSDISLEHGHCDRQFEPKSDLQNVSEEFVDEELEFAMVIDGKTLALVLEDDIKYLFLSVATQCKSVICCRCSPAQKASVVKLVTEPTLMFSPGNITLAIGDGANDVPMIQAANVGVGISGKEGRQAVLSSDYSFAEFRFLKRLLLVHGNYSYKRISKLILFSFMKNVALSLSNFFLAMQTMYSGLLMYFGICFTLYNALFTTIPIVFIAMYNQDVSPAVLMQYPTLYVNGLKNRSFNWITFFGWCGLGMWHAYVIYAVPFFSNGFIVWYFAKDSTNEYLFGSRDLGLWADGVAAYTYLITASTVQVALMTSNWTKANIYSTIGTLIFYYLFMAFFCSLYGWTKTEFYETENGYGVFGELFATAWFWFGLMMAVVAAVLPNFIAKAGRVLFYPEPSHLMREWNRLAKGEDAAVLLESPRLVRRNTGFAFSHFPGESEMAMGTYRTSTSNLSQRPQFNETFNPSQSPSSSSTADESMPSTKHSVTSTQQPEASSNCRLPSGDDETTEFEETVAHRREGKRELKCSCHIMQQQLFRASVPAVDPAEPRTRRCWEWVCGALVNKDKGECVVSVLDTVFVEKQQIWSWFYSTSGGIIRKKPRAKLGIDAVHDEFAKIARGSGNSSNSNGALSRQYAAVCWFGDQIRTMQFFSAHELLTFFNSLAASDGSACLSAFIAPRGGDLDPLKYANMEHEFTLHKSGRPQYKLFRLALGSQKIVSMDSKMNAQVNDLVQLYVRQEIVLLAPIQHCCYSLRYSVANSYVEKSKKVRVVHCVSLFVLDDFGRLFLWRTDAFDTIPATSTAPAASSSALLAAPPHHALTTRSGSQSVYDGPHAVNERILARAKAEAMRKPDEKLIDAILSSPTPQQRRPTLLSTSSSTPNLSEYPSSSSTGNSSFDPFRDEQRSRLRNSRDWEDALQYLPATSTLSRGRRRTISAAHLVSSQKKGCSGDYCHLQINALAAKRLEGKKSVLGGGQQQPSSSGPGPTTEADTRHRSSVFTATAAANAFLESRANDDSLKFQPRVGNRAPVVGSESFYHGQKPSSPQRQQHEETGLAPQFTIPFKFIAQTRAEKQLVDLFVRRYHNGEDGDYLAEEYYGDGEPLGQTFPGYYYQEVHVCKNCFEFYTLVESVRMKAQDQIARKRARKGAKPRGSVSMGSEARRISELLVDFDDRDEPTLIASNEQARRIYLQVWNHARTTILPAITKKDAAELYSFTNPHSAIEMVLSCLGVIFVGKDTSDWTDLKRAVSQEKLLALLHNFDVDHVGIEVVMKAAEHARNPLFSPVHIAPISSCAARFCDWIRTVLQAYAWKHRTAFRDQVTNRELRFLKPELLPAELSEDHEKLNGGGDHTLPANGVHTDPLSKSKSTASQSKIGRQTRQKDAARRAIQEQQMARLAAPSGLADALISGSSEAVFTCQDSVTKIPYSIAGQAVGNSTKCNLVVFHDLFDTLDSTKVFFRSVLARHVGARALFFNFPGQAGSGYSGDSPAASEKTVFNNMWQARRVHELLNYLQHTRAFVLSGLPFHLVGFGNGANIAACYAILHGRAYDGYLQSLVLCNGFAKVDAQLAAILHSAVNVFSCFPPSRPDLPVTFFSKFLFSDAYLAKIDPNLALSIYTAVTNPITLDGRIRICQGTLHHLDLVNQLQEIDVPLVIVQSVENALVTPANVDPFLQGRVNILHAWSHQQPQSNGDMRGKTSKQLRQVLATPKSAFVSWLRAGHELRQECKTYMTDLMELLVTSKENEHIVDDQVVAVRDLEPPQETGATSLQQHSALVPERTPHAGSTRKPPVSISVPVAESLSDASTPEPSQAKVVPRPLQILLDAPLVEEVSIESPIIQEKRQSLKKSAYELQLERSELEFQDAIKTHEAQKAELEKKKWLTKQASKDDPVSPPSQAKLEVQQQKTVAVVAAITPSPVRSGVEGDTGARKTHVAFHSSSSSGLAPPSIPKASTTSQRPQQHEDDAEPANSASLDAEMDEIRQRMVENEQRLAREAEESRAKQRAAAEERMEALQQEQDRRRREWDEEDRVRLAVLERKLQDEQTERLAAMKKRDTDLLSLDISASFGGDVLQIPFSPFPSVLRPASLASPPNEETKQQSQYAKPELPSVFDQLEAEEKAKRKNKRIIGKLPVDGFDEIKTSMQQNFTQGVREQESRLKQELLRRKHAQATCIQKYVRRHFAIQRVTKVRQRVQQERITRFAGGEIVRIVRGFLGRRRFVRYRTQRQEEIQRAFAAGVIQRLFRGHACRVAFVRKLRAKKALILQRVYRGYVGRVRCLELREAQAQRRYMDRNAAKLQATWKMYVARDKFLTSRFSVLAAIEIQRMYRGHLGRVEALRKKQWHDAEPGPERLALGLKMIEGSKQAFERQQSEIDALHRAQEAVERQVSSIHCELQESEKELAVLERELQEIDQLESDLRELTHEAEMLHSGGIEGLLRSSHNNISSSSSKNPTPLGSGIPQPATGAAGAPYEAGVESLFETKEAMKKRQADAYAVEMAIQIKRAERERRKKDLEAEFTSVFSEVQQKRRALGEMEEKLADMEATRMRKDREFARLQRNLMELLEEQKLELENLREKGIELETATATSAAAAAATAMKAKEHEKRSQAMFESTEELMKFQFMSMSLSYFSSLNMLKNLRDINADTTSAAITSTAETAAAAAAAAAAANIPAMNRLKVGGADLMQAASQLKKHELEKKLVDEETVKHAQLQPLPPQVRDWNVDDVGRWLDSLSLSQYKQAFDEGAVDGEFLLELRPEDMSDVLGVTHKLHVRKIVVARNKLLPLTEQERSQLDAVHHEENSSNTRAQVGVPDLDTVFSQARNGRLKRLVESLDAGFAVDEEDDKGNTLLLIACQNVNVKMVELLVAKRANVNHKNAQGNTPLHFAMAYDADGALGEYLIARGADDTIENSFGLTPYDGLTPE